MCRNLRNSVYLMTLLTIAPGGLAVQPTSVGGVVHDAGKAVPNDGLERVTVTLVPQQGASMVTTTDQTGKYQFIDPPKGEFQFVFDRVGYEPRPRQADYADIQNAGFHYEVTLYQKDADEAYYTVAASKFVAQVRTQAAPAAAYRAAWKSLGELELSPTTKLSMAQKIDAQVPEAKEFEPGIKAYARLNLGDLQKVQRQFSEAITEKTELPAKATLEEAAIGNEVVTDVVLHELGGKTGTKEQRAEFVERFTSGWHGSPAATEVMERYDPHQDRLWHRPPDSHPESEKSDKSIRRYNADKDKKRPKKR
jgi:hypothetical protein